MSSPNGEAESAVDVVVIQKSAFSDATEYHVMASKVMFAKPYEGRFQRNPYPTDELYQGMDTSPPCESA
jgi:hypothetical protein